MASAWPWNYHAPAPAADHFHSQWRTEVFLIELGSSRTTSDDQPAARPLAEVRLVVMLKMDDPPDKQSELLVSHDHASQPVPTRCASERRNL